MWIADVQNTFLVNCFSTFPVAPRPRRLLTLWGRVQTSVVALRTFNATCRPPHLPIPFHSRQHYLHVRHGGGWLIKPTGSREQKELKGGRMGSGEEGTEGPQAELGLIGMHG